MFTFSTRDLQEGEVLFQYEGVPSQLADFVHMEDKIPVIHLLESPNRKDSATRSPVPSPAVPTTAVAETPKPLSAAQKTAPANAFIKAYLAPAISKGENARDPTAGPGRPTPGKHFGSRLTEVRKEHDGYNIPNTKELEQWQSEVLSECAENSPLVEVAEYTNIEVETMLAGAKGEQDDDELDSKALLRHVQLNAALSGSGPQLGPDVALSALALGLSERNDGMFREKFLKTKVSLYPWQVSGVAYMLVTSYGHIPTHGLPKEHMSKPEVQHALENLERLPMHGGFIADQTGMGKTIKVLYFLSWVSRYHIGPSKGGDTKTNKAKLVLAPTMLVEQWTEGCANLFPDLAFGVMYTEAENMKAKVSALHCISNAPKVQGLVPGKAIKTTILQSL